MSLTRRSFLASASASLPLLAQKKAAAGLSPNIVLITASDVGAWMLGCYGNKEIRTPNIDRLAAAGVRFTAGFTCTPASSPSRATLLTGRTPMQHGIQDYLDQSPSTNPPQGQFEVPPSFAKETMLSDVLGERGYRCGFVGRWDLGGDQTPQHRLDYWYTTAGRPIAYQNPEMCLNGQTVDEKGYLADLITAKALGFLDQQQKGTPFLLVISHANAHAPYDGHPQKYYDLYKDVRFNTLGWEPAAANALRDKGMLGDIVGNIRKCAAAVTALDDQIPPVLAKLRDRGLADNTIIVFTSDHGSLLGRHGLWGAGLASSPANMYDEVANVPLLWSWPGRSPVQSSRPELVGLYDVLPTLCDACGVDAPQRNLCGRSFLSIVQGALPNRKNPWVTTVFGNYRDMYMARDNRFKLVLRGDKGPNEFFDDRNDAREKVNQYDNPQFVTARDHLAKDLAAWRQKYSSSPQ